jgi:hypothetical protein
MWQKIVGVFCLGHENVQLVVREGTGGEFYYMPDEQSMARIKIGLDLEWSEVVMMLLHETFEMVMARDGRRFESCAKRSRDHATYTFVFNHSQFSQFCWAQSEFVTAALPRLAEEYKKRKNKKR